MLTTILISFAAFCFGFFLAGFMAGSKKANKTLCEDFEEANNKVFPHLLNDDDLRGYWAVCKNGVNDAEKEMKRRKIW